MRQAIYVAGCFRAVELKASAVPSGLAIKLKRVIMARPVDIWGYGHPTETGRCIC